MTVKRDANGAAMAAILGAAIGAFGLGLFVLLHEAGVFSAPALYGPAGGLSGRTTFAVILWLLSWAVLHARWKNRDIAPRPIAGGAVLLVAAGVIATFPPVWRLL